MSQLKIENHNSVALLNRLRIATRSTTSRERRAIFNWLKDALKGLGMIEAKGPVEGIYEGIDANGNHWFMVQQASEQSEAVSPRQIDEARNFKELLESISELRVAMGNPALGWNREQSSLSAAVVKEATRRLKAEQSEAVQAHLFECSHKDKRSIDDDGLVNWCSKCGAIQQAGEWLYATGLSGKP